METYMNSHELINSQTNQLQTDIDLDYSKCE